MPISKNGRLYFTDAQCKAAQEYSALEYAQAAGYDLIKDSSVYRLRQHDSMIFTKDGRWYWNSQGFYGRALELLLHYEQRSLPEAVNMLTSGPIDSTKPPGPPVMKKSIALPQKPFELPEKAPTFKRLFAYLCNTRQLDVEIIQELVRQKRIYESIRRYRCSRTGEIRIAHNVVFVGYDERGQPRSAFQRGTNTGVSFKQEVAGSQKKYAFICPGREGVTKVSVFEAAIDAISHATLAKISGMDWQDQDRLPLGGTAYLALEHYLQNHPKILHIDLCLDNDAAGIKGTQQLIAALKTDGYDESNGYSITVSSPPIETGKDWNNYLGSFRQILGQNMGQ